MKGTHIRWMTGRGAEDRSLCNRWPPLQRISLRPPTLRHVGSRERQKPGRRCARAAHAARFGSGDCWRASGPVPGNAPPQREPADAALHLQAATYVRPTPPRRPHGGAATLRHVHDFTPPGSAPWPGRSAAAAIRPELACARTVPGGMVAGCAEPRHLTRAEGQGSPPAPAMAVLKAACGGSPEDDEGRVAGRP